MAGWQAMEWRSSAGWWMPRAPTSLLLHDLRGADAGGLSLLRRLVAEGMAIAGLSTYIQLMLANSASVGPLESHAHTRPEPPVRSNES